MADDKKKISAPSDSRDPMELVIAFIVVVVLGLFIAERLRAFLSSPAASLAETRLDAILMFFLWLKPYAIGLSYVLSAIFLGGIVYAIARLTPINKKLNEFYYPSPAPAESEVRNARWQRVIDHLESGNEQEWRLAIIEADVMLNELLEKLEYRGDTIADKLKQVEKSDFTTIELAWEAHKIRNAIAHEGGDFLLSEREARRVIDLFRQVFKEFLFI